MILTVTLNPLLEHRLTYKEIKIGTENRGAKEEYKAGGKGINVSRQLNILSMDNLAYTFTGGNNGKFLKKILFEEKINFTPISTHSETRLSAIIIDESKKIITSCFGNNPQITMAEADEFKLRLEKMIPNCEMVIFSGSSPCRETNSIFPFGIQIANQCDKISVCDTYGVHLKDCIEASPTILHNNVEEVEKSLNISLRSENEISNHLKFLHTKSIKQAFITDGMSPSFASNFDFIYKVKNPKVDAIDSTGSGDCFVAGIIYGWHNNLPFEETVIFASSLGAVNATRYDVCNVTVKESNEFKDLVEIKPLGKKMRLVDVKPS